MIHMYTGLLGAGMTRSAPEYVVCDVCGCAFKAAGLAIHMSVHTRIRSHTKVVREPVLSYRQRLKLERLK